MEYQDAEYIKHTVRKKICPVCKKEFHCAAARWGWKIGGKLYCSYHCMRVDEKAMQEDRKIRDRVDYLTHDPYGKHIGGERMKSEDRKILDEICEVMVRHHMTPDKIRLIQENYIMLTTAKSM